MTVELEKLTNDVKNAYSDSDDLIVKNFDVNLGAAAVCYLDGFVDKDILTRDVLSSLTGTTLSVPVYDCLKNLPFPEVIDVSVELGDVLAHIAKGDVVLLIDGAEGCFCFPLRQTVMRGITEPPTESVLRGPREGFIEDIKANTTLIRRKIKSEKLVITNMSVGEQTHTSVAVCYIDGIADKTIISTVKERISKIKTDGILDSYYIEQYLCENKYSLFTQVGSSEKPDVVAAKLLEGRIAIIVDGSPSVLTVPFLLFEAMQDAYDYYSNDWRASLIRIFRIIGMLLTIFLPAAYVAFETFHFHLLPLKFLITLLNATNGIPFPPQIEILLVLLLFEILNQASIRMPRFLGISLSIVGAIVLGDTAVKAGLISSPAVLIIALSSIGIFCVPSQVNVISMLRTIFVCIAAVLGLYGLLIATIMTVCYIVSINNYGTPFAAPFAPIVSSDLKDGLLKSLNVNQKTRPLSFPNHNRRRK
ncbi:MAG: spore germination protein [Acidaminococcus sp.]|nr:spore germination protein [Acidaminococcus sp.]MDD7398143.1 spore germination protein [Bacillota bacterium]